MGKSEKNLEGQAYVTEKTVKEMIGGDTWKTNFKSMFFTKE